MQQSISKDHLLELFDQLSPFQQQTVFTFVDAMSRTKANRQKRDKSALLNLSVWNDDDIQVIEDNQRRNR